MSISNLIKHFKSSPTLTTDVSDFTYIEPLGEGGNSTVLLFEKGRTKYAVKFLEIHEIKKIQRFKDEYFCAAQIPTHPNISQLFHFDKVEISGSPYFIVIMKAYSGTLKILKNDNDNDLTGNLWSIFQNLCNGLKHLHNHGITHRDIKPQNIFLDAKTGQYVIGDLGIAHFDEDRFTKEAKTKANERTGNYLFSAPEQANNNERATFSSDIFALGQVMHWLVTGTANRGIDRSKFSKENSPKRLKLLDSIVDQCLKNNPTDRFQSIESIEEFIGRTEAQPIRDMRDRMRDLDLCIRQSFPEIIDLYSTEDQHEIDRFILNFNNICKAEEFWYQGSSNGDGELAPFEKLEDGNWLFNKYSEIKIKRLTIYKDPSCFYKSFFAFTIEPSKPFKIIDNRGKNVSRGFIYNLPVDEAVLWNGNYISAEKTHNGYYNTGTEVIPVTEPEFQTRFRYTNLPYAYIVIPNGSGASRIIDRAPTSRLLSSALGYSGIDKHDIKQFLQKIEDHHSNELTIFD
ncbi:serine/threonine-protein kinase [Pseudomonas poae]|nr:serine/threonine-protein kinase [Pseudomonas poae]